MYESVIGKFTTVDPGNEFWSPYLAMANNPILRADPRGDTTVVTTSGGDYLFKLNDGLESLTTLTAKQLYDQGTQWFSPKADNFMELLDVNPEIGSILTMSFAWSDIVSFSEQNFYGADFLQGGDADWKSAVAKGYFLILVEGKPYWSDAVGQIPYGIWAFRETGSVRETLDLGIKYGQGKMIGGLPETKNTYDIYWVLKGALYGKSRYHNTGNGSYIESGNKPNPQMFANPIKRTLIK